MAPAPDSPRTAVVVGGASGIGRASAVALAADGCTVVVADLDADAARAVAEQAGLHAAQVDVTDEASVDALFEQVVAEHGSLDVVVNSAGTGTLGLVTEHPLGEWQRVLDVNLTGTFLVLKHAGRRMAAGGAITSLSSLNGRQPGAGMAAYCTAKAGVSMLTQVAALELGPKGVRVNAVAPGIVVTPLTEASLEIPGVRDDYLDNTPLGRAGTAEEVADAVVWVSRAAWLTGEVLDLNGGAHLQRYPDLHAHVLKAYG